MEKDYSDIHLLDVGLNTKWGFYNYFLKNHITTVAQVLDDETMQTVRGHLRKPRIQNELSAFIDFIKFRFLGISLIADVYLDNSMVELEQPNPEFLSRMGFLEGEVFYIHFLYNTFKSQHSDALEKNYTILDVFQYGLERNLVHNKETEFKIRMLLDSYHKSNDRERSMESLKDELLRLEDKKKQLEKEYENLEAKLDSLKNIISGGSTK